MLCNKLDSISGKMILHSDHDRITSESQELTLLRIDDKDEAEMISMSNARRKALQMNPDQDLMLALAWVRPEELDMAYLYPEVLMVDVVCGVNREQLPLLTITGITRFNKVFTVLRAYLPNQRRWMFKWIFSIVVPLFLGKRTIKKQCHHI